MADPETPKAKPPTPAPAPPEPKPVAKSNEPEQFDKYGNSRAAWRAWKFQQDLFDEFQASRGEMAAADLGTTTIK